MRRTWSTYYVVQYTPVAYGHEHMRAPLCVCVACPFLIILLLFQNMKGRCSWSRREAKICFCQDSSHAHLSIMLYNLITDGNVWHALHGKPSACQANFLKELFELPALHYLTPLAYAGHSYVQFLPGIFLYTVYSHCVINASELPHVFQRDVMKFDLTDTSRRRHLSQSLSCRDNKRRGTVHPSVYYSRLLCRFRYEQPALSVLY